MKTWLDNHAWVKQLGMFLIGLIAAAASIPIAALLGVLYVVLLPLVVVLLIWWGFIVVMGVLVNDKSSYQRDYYVDPFDRP